ncbi:MAG: glycosyltransferase family 4 protein [Minisyncoccia bacterium]
MKIAVHGSHLCQEREDGNQTYILNLFRAIKNIDTENEYIFYYNKPSSKIVESSNFQHKVHQAKFMWTQRVFPFLLTQDKPDVLFMPIQMLPFLKSRKQKAVVTIHDLAFLLYPETFPAKDAFLHKLYVREAITKADHLIAITEATKQDIIKFYKINPDKITVVYHGVDKNRFRLIQEGEESLVADVKSKYNITKSYILYIGNVQPRKNIQGLIKAYQKLRKTTDHNYQLVIAGAKAWLVEDVMKEIGDDYRDDIIFTGRFEDIELAPLLWGSDLFVLPSFYEGFGLPILEAMACGVPTVVSNTPSLVEVGGSASMSFDPHSIDDMAKVLDNIISNPNLRQEMRDNGLKRVAEFSWDRCAQETINVIKAINSL